MNCKMAYEGSTGECCLLPADITLIDKIREQM